MAVITFTPEWYYGIDAAFEVVSIIVCFLVAFFGRKIYCFTKSNTCQHMSYAFTLLGTSLLIKVITNLIIFWETIENTNLQHINLIYSLGYFFHRALFIIGLLVLLLIALRVTDMRILALFAIFTSISIAFGSYSYYIYHLLILIILWFIVLHYSHNYHTRKTPTARLVYVSFMSIFFAHILYLLVEAQPDMYVAAEGVQLFGFLCLMANHILITRKK